MISKTRESFQDKKFWVWGQITNFGSFWVKFQNLSKVCKSYNKMKLLTSLFIKADIRIIPYDSYEVTRGQKSPKRSSFMNLNKIKKYFAKFLKFFDSLDLLYDAKSHFTRRIKSILLLFWRFKSKREKKLRFSRGLTEYIPSICQLVK